MGNRGYWVVASLGIGILQSWDSGAFSSGALVIALTMVGILLPTISIAMDIDHGFRIGALIAGCILLVAARMLAPVSLNTLHLALFPATVYIIFVKGLSLGAKQPAA
jgi:hypothetical protein